MVNDSDDDLSETEAAMKQTKIKNNSSKLTATVQKVLDARRVRRNHFAVGKKKKNKATNGESIDQNQEENEEPSVGNY